MKKGITLRRKLIGTR